MLSRRRRLMNITSVNQTAYAIGTATDANGKTINTLTANGTAFGTVSNSNNNMIYTPRQIQLGVRLQF
jgi:hypothetical protein